MLNELKLRLKLWARSRYILKARSMIERVGFKYIKMLVYELPLDKEIPKGETRVPVEIKLISASDVINGRYKGIPLASGDDPLQHNKTLSRLSNGDIGFAAMVGDRVAGFAWIYMQKTKYEQIIEREITFGDDESTIYDGLLFPEFQRNNIAQKLYGEMRHFLKSRDFKNLITYVEADNIPSIKLAERQGCYLTKVITYLKVFGLKRIREYPVNRREAE